MADYVEINSLSNNSNFFSYQNQIIQNVDSVPSHEVIDKYINEYGMDYRYEETPSPRAELRNRKTDNTTLGRVKEHASVRK